MDHKSQQNQEVLKEFKHVYGPFTFPDSKDHHGRLMKRMTEQKTP